MTEKCFDAKTYSIVLLPYSEPTVTVNGRKLKVVDKFTYPGSTLERAVHIGDEVTARIAKAM